jgi:hypothetical protein
MTNVLDNGQDGFLDNGLDGLDGFLDNGWDGLDGLDRERKEGQK